MPHLWIFLAFLMLGLVASCVIADRVGGFLPCREAVRLLSQNRNSRR